MAGGDGVVVGNVGGSERGVDFEGFIRVVCLFESVFDRGNSEGFGFGSSGGGEAADVAEGERRIHFRVLRAENLRSNPHRIIPRIFDLLTILICKITL